MNAPLNQHRREPFWDVLKGILIYLVVLGHFVQYGTTGDFWQHPLFRGIYIFHMPLFILVSGYFGVHSLSRPWSPFLRKLFIHLLLPIAVFYLCQLLILSLYCPKQPLVDYFRGMWFLWVLFGCHLTTKIMHEINNYLLKIMGGVTIYIIACLLHEVDVPHAAYFVFLWPFYLIGICLSYYKINFYTRHRLLFFLLPLYSVALLVFKSEWLIYRSPLSLAHPVDSLPIYIFRLVCGVVSCATILPLVHWLVCAGVKWRWLQCLGQHTLFIYVSQSIFFLWIIYSDTPVRPNDTWSLVLYALLLTSALCGCSLLPSLRFITGRS